MTKIEKGTLYVRSEDHIAIYNSSSTGRILTKEQVLERFGAYIFDEIDSYGVAIIDQKDIAKVLKDKRIEFGLTEIDIAKRVGITVEYVKYIECSKRGRVSIHILDKIAKVLSLSIDDLAIKH